MCNVTTLPSDGIVLATGLLSEGSDDPAIPHDRLSALSDEIEGVLAQIRAANPATLGIHAQPDYVPAAISVGLDPKLLEAMNLAASTDADTGFADFDKLSRWLGLSGWRTGYSGGYALLCFSGQVNLLATAAAYEKADGVRSAEADPYRYIPEVIPNDIEVAKEGDTWYAVMRERSESFTNPPAVYFFTVSGGTVAEVPASEAGQSPIFARLAQACAK